MEGINQRISDCIKAIGIKKTVFAERLNVSQAFITQLTKGTSLPSDRTTADICREFNVSEHWLRTGEGEMFVQVSEDAEFMQIMAEIQVSDDEFIRSLLKTYWRLPDNEKAVIKKMIDGINKKEMAGQ